MRRRLTNPCVWRAIGGGQVWDSRANGGWLGLALSGKWQSTLAFEEICASPKAPSTRDPGIGIVVHGLLGAGRNWRSFSQRLARQAADTSGREWRLFLVDMRNHGASSRLQGFHPPHTMEAAAEDLVNLFKRKIGTAPELIAGHSMGGKVVLEYTRLLKHAGSGSPKQVWILDSQPGLVPPGLTGNRDVDRVLEAVKTLQEPIKSRQWLYDHLQAKGFSLGLAQWLGSNLEGRPEEELKWLFDVEGASSMYEEYKCTDCLPILNAPPEGTTINVVIASKSDRWNGSMVEELKRMSNNLQGKQGAHGLMQCHVLENAGHWLHVDNPAGLLKMMLPSLS